MGKIASALILFGPPVLGAVFGIWQNIRLTKIVKGKSKWTVWDTNRTIIMFVSDLILILYIIPFIWEQIQDG